MHIGVTAYVCSMEFLGPLSRPRVVVDRDRVYIGNA